MPYLRGKMVENSYELFFGKQSPFSHHHACKFKLEGVVFHCMEQYMMYKKAEVFGDEDIKYKVLKSRSPADIKHLGRQVKEFDILTWMKVAIDIVKSGNHAKFSQNERLKRALYKTYPKQMVEASPSDTRWGIGLGVDNPNAYDESRWRGRNLLGKLLTNLRDEMMMNDEEIPERTLPLLKSDQSDVEQKLLQENEHNKSRQRSCDRRQNWRSNRNLQSRTFEFFWEPDSPFSTLHDAEFKVEGKKFCCIEQYLLYRKADMFGDDKSLATIMQMTRGSDFKKKIDIHPFDGRKWGESCKDIYKQGARAKFKQNPDMMEMLSASFPKIILRVQRKDQQYFESNPTEFKRGERRHWSEFALMEVRDELMGKDSQIGLAFNSSDSRSNSRNRDKKRSHDHKDDYKSQKKSKNHQRSPDVIDVSNLFSEDLNMNSDEKMNVDTESNVDWFENNTSTSEASTSEQKKREENSFGSSQKKKEKELTGSRSTREEEKEKEPSGSGSTREQEKEKEPSGSGSTREEEKEKEPSGSGSTREQEKEKEPTGSGRTKEEKKEKEATGSETTRMSPKKSKKDKKKSKKDARSSEEYVRKDRNSTESGKNQSDIRGSPQKSTDTMDGANGSATTSNKSTEKQPDVPKPTKNYRKLKFSSLPDDKKYTFIDNTSPLSFEAECKLTIDGMKFVCVEHYVAYKKAEFFGDQHRMKKIKDAVETNIIKRLDREISSFDAKTWFANHVNFYREACKEKFLQNPELKWQLFDTYPTNIYRSGKSDRRKGAAVDHKKLDKQDRNNKQDVNNVLINIRDELMKREELID